MSFKKFAAFIAICILIISCKKELKLQLEAPSKIQIHQPFEISLKDKNNNELDSIVYLLDKEKIYSSDNPNAVIDITTKKLGKHELTAIAYLDAIVKKRTKTVYFLADKGPDIYTYKIINTYPHDKKAYTQGLEISNDTLYESTGSYGQSSLRRVDLKTGDVLQKIDLDRQYFGEGMTKFNDKIFMLTWMKKVGFIFDPKTFEQIGEFKYQDSQQGWGLTNDGKQLIKSDGTERIWFLNAATQQEEDFIEVYTNRQKVDSINEIEYINGKIYANIYLEKSIIIINPKNGTVEAVVNLAGLYAEVEKTQKLKPRDEVLNGIAFDNKTQKLYVTGKNWGKLFEIELIKQ